MLILNRQQQAVRVATPYAPAPLLPVGAQGPRAPLTRRNVAVVSHARPIRSHGHRCTCLKR